MKKHSHDFSKSIYCLMLESEYLKQLLKESDETFMKHAKKAYRKDLREYRAAIKLLKGAGE